MGAGKWHVVRCSGRSLGRGLKGGERGSLNPDA